MLVFWFPLTSLRDDTSWGLAMLPYQVKCLTGAPLAFVNGTYTDKFLVCHSVLHNTTDGPVALDSALVNPEIET